MPNFGASSSRNRDLSLIYSNGCQVHNPVRAKDSSSQRREIQAKCSSDSKVQTGQALNLNAFSERITIPWAKLAPCGLLNDEGKGVIPETS
jgi:hypothetical protein